MRKKKSFKHYILFIISLFFIGLGIALTKHGELGVSPVSSVANVLSLRCTVLSFGAWLIVSYCLFLIGQILVLRRRFQAFQLLQIPMAVLFGHFTDFGMWVVQFIPNELYVVRLLLVIFGSAVLGLGIAFSIKADVILNSPEAFVKALAVTTRKKFGNIKIMFDICWVALAVVLSLLLFDGKLIGVREGTVISAFLVGTFTKCFQALLNKIQLQLNAMVR